MPHGQCYLWQASLLWLHVAADLLIAIAYFSIPVTLFHFLRQQQENPFQKIIILFSWFILSGGTTHLLSIWTLWHPDYWLSGAVKLTTGLVSLYTAIELVEFIPQALSLPNAQVLERVNQDLAVQSESNKKIKSELEAERSFLRTMLDSIAVGIVASDEKGKLAMFNRWSQEVFGTFEPLSPDQWAQNYGLYQSDGKTLLAEDELPLVRAFKGETFTNAEFICQQEKNPPKILSANGSPILDSENKRLGAVVAVTDITEIRQNEEQLKKVNAELLISNQELEGFAYIASHDLREPLRMVISFTQLLAQRYQGQLDEEADTIIGFAVDGAKRMEILIEDLLRYSRIGKNGKSLKIVNCNRVLEKAIANVQLLIEETDAVVSVKSLPKVMGDEFQLVQLFQNLISNAISYRGKEPPKIAIDAVARDKGWLFTVEDNGIGIAPQDTQRIFEVFQRLHPKGQDSGTGIGLAICRKIVERHGGQIWVESVLGEGSSFRLTLNTRNFDSM